MTDTEKGTDIRIDYGKKSGQSYPTTDIRPMRRTTRLGDTDEQVSTLLESVTPAADVFEKTTHETCERVLNDTLGHSDTTTGTSETTRYSNTTNTATQAKTDNSLEGVADIESAFEDLLAS